MKKAKKVLALVLSIVMLLSALPTAVFAAENEAEYVFSDSMQAFLSLESIVQLNVGFKLTADGADLSAAEAAALESNVGLLVWKGETAPADAAIETCDVVLGAVYNAAKGRYEVKTDGIPAKELGDALCFMPYYTDGMEYTYGRMIEGYSPKEYCYGQIAAGGSDTAVNAAILNYGAAAQEYFAYNTENLMNADLTEEQKALNWDGSLVRSEWAVPAEKEGELSRGAQIASRGGYLSLEGTIDVNFYFGADMDVADAEVLLWTEYAYNAAEVLAEENASLVKELTWNAEKSRYEYKYEGIAAKEMFSPVYACAKFTDAEGNVCYSGVVAYCAERYAYIAQNDADPALADLAKRIAIYGDAARTYFGNVELPDVGGGNQPEVPGINTDLTADVELTADGTVASEVSMSNGEVGATVPAGVAADKTTLTLQVSEKASSDADVEAGENETALSLDVHVDGVSASNTTAIIVKLGKILPKALNIGNVALYHVENGVTNEMTRVMTMEELDAHNEYYYDPVTGEVSVAMASFSEVAVVSTDAVWNGIIADAFSNGSGTKEDPYIIANADQLARMSKLVSNDEAYAKAHYKLIADVNFDGDNVAANDLKDKVFYPIGYWKEQGTNDQDEIYYGHGNSFSGTFDGNGNAVRNIYQNTWLMDGDYEAGYWSAAMGLFGAVYDATIKNLTIDNFQSDGEFTPTGCVAAYAGGESVFENITLTNCNPRVYNTGNGGIVGLNYNSTDGTADQITFRNIAIDQTNKISALWGSYDVGCGGIMGRLRENSKHDGTNTDGQKNTVHFENCHVAAIMDVYNDVCANYQYYQYRYAGMMIGTVDYIGDVPEVGLTDVVTAENCTVTYGDWNEYWYCELVKNSLASYTHDHQFSRLTEISDISEIKSGDTWLKEGNFVLPNEDNTAAECYHIFKDSENNLYQHLHDVADATNPDIFETSAVDGDSNGFDSVAGKYLKEDRQRYYIPFGQLFTGYGWGSSPVRDGYDGITITDDDSNLKAQEKFTYIGAKTIAPDEAITIDELFKAIVATEKISKTTVQVFVSPVGEESTVDATYASKTDWTQGTLTFTGTGTAKLVITDYYYCTPTVIYITVGEEEVVPVEKFTAKDVGEKTAYGEITLGDLFSIVTDAVLEKDVTAVVTNANGTETIHTTASDWASKTIKLTALGNWSVVITDGELCIPETATFTVTAVDKFTANNTVGEQKAYTQITLGTLFGVKDGMTIGNVTANITVNGKAHATITVTEADWKAQSIDLTKDGTWTVAIKDDDALANGAEVSFTVNAVDKFEKLFNKDFLYRVGNQNAVTLGYIFGEDVNKTYPVKLSAVNVTVTNIAGDAAGTFTSNATWTNGTIQFTGTGVVKVTISADGANDVSLNLEVVEAKNATTAASATANNVVLLQSVSGSFSVYNGYTLYGNDFTVTLPTTVQSKYSAGYVGYVTVNNGNLDNVRIEGPVYPEMNIYREQAVDSVDNTKANYFYNSVYINGGNCTISNSYISGSRTAVCIRGGNNVVIDNTTISGGAVANMEIAGASSVTLRDVTTVQPNTNDVKGMGVFVTSGVCKIYVEGELTQRNWVSQEQWNELVGTYASFFPEFFTDSKFAPYQKSIDGTVYVNLAMIFACNWDESYLDISAQSNGSVYAATSGVKLQEYTGGVYSVTGYNPTAEDLNEPNYQANGFSPISPTFAFDNTVNNDDDDESDAADTYCVYNNDSGVLKIGVSGDSKIIDLSGVSVVKNGEVLAHTTYLNGYQISGNSVTIMAADGAKQTLKFVAVSNDMGYDKDGAPIEGSIEYTWTVTVEMAVLAFPAPVWNMGGDYQFDTTNCVYAYYKTSQGYGEAVPIYEGIKISYYNKQGTLVDKDLSGTKTLPTGSENANGTAFSYTLDDGSVLTMKFVSGWKSGATTHQFTTYNDKCYIYPQSLDNDNYIRAKTTNQDFNVQISYTFTDPNGQSTGAQIMQWYNAKASNGSVNTVQWKTFDGTNGKEGGGSCVTPDTMVMLADGTQKRIDEVTYNDQLLVWNFYTGSYDAAPSSIIFNMGDDVYNILHMVFEDGTTVKTINGHRFFDVEAKQYVSISESNVEQYLNRSFAKVDGDTYAVVKLVDYCVTEEYSGCYSIMTAEHYNFMVNGMFSDTFHSNDAPLFEYFEIGEGMMFDAVKMQADIETYGLYSYDLFAEYLTYEQFVAFGCPYMKVSVGKGQAVFEDILALIATYVNP